MQERFQSFREKTEIIKTNPVLDVALLLGVLGIAAVIYLRYRNEFNQPARHPLLEKINPFRFLRRP